ncbi:myo-inosose-2 dehydratase [Tetragenococcus solitarius]|uniref:Myo-inosose-2 dehydratase n=1 Tax=Tetragenococcus solitarius TaxID=71453 RepID=A0ABN3Y5K1_9ENTE|nr:myo-inosose-2 dehydratase [Tetragenococcus solitarius]
MIKRDNIQLGIAPIAWVEDDMPEYGKETTFLQTISEIALLGFEGTEIGALYPRDTNILNEELNRRNLKAITAWISLYLLEQPYWLNERDFRDHMGFLKKAGAKVINVSDQSFSIQHRAHTYFKNKPELTEEQWIEFTDKLNPLGKIAKDEGLEIVYHPHMTTTVQTAEEIDKFLQLTDPETISIIYDTGHLTFSGEDPVAVLEKHFDRIKHIHLKDVRTDIMQQCIDKKLSFLESILEGVFTIPGGGDIDFPKIFNILAEREYQGWLVLEAEQNPYVYNPLDYSRKGRDYMLQFIEG